MSLVSIIIPYFKKKNYFKLTINSILKQKYQNFEILIVYDDEDKSDLGFIYNLKKLDKRIKIIINNKNLFHDNSSARLRALSKAPNLLYTSSSCLSNIPDKITLLFLTLINEIRSIIIIFSIFISIIS